MHNMQNTRLDLRWSDANFARAPPLRPDSLNRRVLIRIYNMRFKTIRSLPQGCGALFLRLTASAGVCLRYPLPSGRATGRNVPAGAWSRRVSARRGCFRAVARGYRFLRLDRKQWIVLSIPGGSDGNIGKFRGVPVLS